MRWKVKLLSGLVLAGLLCGLTGVAWAEETGEEVGLRGQVLATEVSDLVVRTVLGEECRVITDEKTRFCIPGVPSPNIDNIDAGTTLAYADRGTRAETCWRPLSSSCRRNSHTTGISSGARCWLSRALP